MTWLLTCEHQLINVEQISSISYGEFQEITAAMLSGDLEMITAEPETIQEAKAAIGFLGTYLSLSTHRLFDFRIGHREHNYLAEYLAKFRNEQSMVSVPPEQQEGTSNPSTYPTKPERIITK